MAEQSERTVVPVDKPERMTEDFEFGQYVHALAASSNRIRYLIFAVAITTVVVLVSSRHSHPYGWTMSRVAIVRETLGAEIWDARGKLTKADALDVCAKEVQAGAPKWPLGMRDRSAEIAEISARHGFRNANCWHLNYVVAKLGLRDKEAVEKWLDKIEQEQVSGVIIKNMPFLGVPFDVNDLGIFSGLTYTILMVALWFAMVRHQENLYLSMWKVCEMAQKKDGPNPEGRANLLYHALAMSQLFTTPPTLARWQTSFTDQFPRLFFLIPAVMQGYIGWNDLDTFDRGSMVNEKAAVVGWTFEVVTFVVIILAGISCVLHARASDKEWIKTFRILNPHYDLKLQPSWREWLRLKRKAQAPGWGIAVHLPDPKAEPHVYVADFWSGKVWSLAPQATSPELIVRKRCRELGVTPAGVLYGEHIPHDPPSKKWTYSRWNWCAGTLTEESPAESMPPLGQGVLRDKEENRYCMDGRGPGKVQVLYKAPKDGSRPAPLAGGRRGVWNGKGEEAGFEWVQDITVDEDGIIYLTDGGCVRQVTQDGEVKTLGGTPIGRKPRYRRSRLLGIAVTPEAFYAADYDWRHIWKIPRQGPEEKCQPVEIWHAGRLWSPAGLAVAGDHLYILEHRPDTLIGKIRRWIGPWSRVRKANLKDPKAKPTVLLELGWFRKVYGRSSKADPVPPVQPPVPDAPPV